MTVPQLCQIFQGSLRWKSGKDWEKQCKMWQGVASHRHLLRDQATKPGHKPKTISRCYLVSMYNGRGVL